jgi:ABC-2 type transport system permease protein
VRLQERDVPSAGLSDTNPFLLASPHRAILEFVSKTLAIAELEVRKLRHDWSELITRAVQPVLWLLLFGEVFARARAIPTGDIPYVEHHAHAYAAPVGRYHGRDERHL